MLKHRVLQRALVILLILCVCPMSLFGPMMVSAAEGNDGGLYLSTTYPGVAVKAGGTTNLPIKMTNLSEGDMVLSLSTECDEENWSFSFEGNSMDVQQAYVSTMSESSVSLAISVPITAQPGVYYATVTATDEVLGISDSLTIQMTIKEKSYSDGFFRAQYTKLEGSSATEFAYTLQIENNSSEIQTYSLNAEVPRGWTSYFTPSYEESQISSISVDANNSKTLSYYVKATQNVAAGEYIVPCTASSALETLTLDLSVTITGMYAMTLTTGSGMLNVESAAGKAAVVPLVITNTGTLDLNNVELSGLCQDGWDLKFETASIDSIPVGSSKTVNLYITPSGSSISGDYAVQINASTAELNNNLALRVTVQTSYLWGAIAVLIILLLLLGLAWVFKKFGRR